MEDVQVGPWGGKGGSYKEFKPNGRIIKIYIRHGGCIDSIAFDYICSCDGNQRRSENYGGEGGKLESMSIETDEEIVELSGTIGSYSNFLVITSLSFKTNKKTCTYGTVSGEKFSLPVNINKTKFAGFHGGYGMYVDSLGAFLGPK